MVRSTQFASQPCVQHSGTLAADAILTGAQVASRHEVVRLTAASGGESHRFATDDAVVHGGDNLGGVDPAVAVAIELRAIDHAARIEWYVHPGHDFLLGDLAVGIAIAGAGSGVRRGDKEDIERMNASAEAVQIGDKYISRSKQRVWCDVDPLTQLRGALETQIRRLGRYERNPAECRLKSHHGTRLEVDALDPDLEATRTLGSEVGHQPDNCRAYRCARGCVRAGRCRSAG